MDFFIMNYQFTFLSLHLDVLDENIDQVEAAKILRCEKVWPTPIKFSSQDRLFRKVDFVGSTLVNLCVVSEKFVNVLTENVITGWTTYPVNIVDHAGKPIAGYRGLAVTGRCGRILWDDSEKITIPAPSSSGRETKGWRGLPFDESTWDGSGICLPEAHSNFMIVCERTKKVVEKRKLSNVGFKSTKALERNWNQTAEGKTVFEWTE